jgi:hypothetical protein
MSDMTNRENGPHPIVGAEAVRRTEEEAMVSLLDTTERRINAYDARLIFAFPDVRNHEYGPDSVTRRWLCVDREGRGYVEVQTALIYVNKRGRRVAATTRVADVRALHLTPAEFRQIADALDGLTPADWPPDESDDTDVE